MNNDVVAFLLDESVPAERLGELLRGARKRRGWKRRQAARHAGISADRLREYERGLRPIPADVCLRLADCYGDDLTAHVPLRVPPRVSEDAIVVDTHTRVLRTGASEEVLTGYVDIVARLRRARPGEPVALRASDVAALAAVLDCEPSRIEQRIVELLECTREEARALHNELLRRKVILPVAGLAAGVVALTGFTAASADDSKPPPSTVSTVATTPTTVVPLTTPTTFTPVMTPTTPAPAPAASDPEPNADDAPAAETPSDSQPPDDQPTTDATVPADQLPDEVTPPLDRPVVDPNDTTPMSIPPGEHVVIIGTPSSATDGSAPSDSVDAG